MNPSIRPIEDRRLLAIGLFVFAYVFFTTLDTCAKWMTQNGIPLVETVFIRYAVHFVLVLALLAPRQGFVSIMRTQRPGLEVLRALMLLGSTVVNFIALQYLPLTVTGAIFFTQPLILCALSVPLLGETVGWRRWAAILIGFAGVLVIVRPGTEAFHPAVFLALLCAVFGALYLVLTRKLAGVDSTGTQQFYVGLIPTLGLAPFALGNWVWPSDPVTWLAFGLIGVAAVVGHQMVTLAHRFAPASALAPFAYLQIIWMAGASWLFFAQPPTFWLLVGAPLVIGSGLYIWLRERQLGKAAVLQDQGV